jgi:membrane associated rhomboid family serine protease
MTEFRPGGFNVIPPVIKNLLIVNVLIFFAQMTFENNQAFSIEGFFALHDVRSYYFKPHQLITYMFLHGSIEHIFFNMFALYMFGAILENLWGAKRFLVFYVICGLGAGALHLLVLYFEMTPVVEELRPSPFLTEERARELYMKLNTGTLGASGSVFGCLAAFGYLFPNSLIYLYFLFPVKAKWFVMFYAGIELFMGIRNSAGDNVAHWAHLGGAAVGILMVMYWNKNNRKRFY